ncbi:MAG TPA: hypothetical protein VJX31_05200, partial [Casimicrobiaceae bacterium]|nr:hypothetical protein [Casimicrobiaceae bacterium]
MSRAMRGWMLAVPVVCAGALYARFFGGYWLGDDFGNLQTSWLAMQRGETLTRAWQQLFEPAASEGAFYRPAMIASLLFNAAVAGTRFAGWFAVNWAVHLANMILVGHIVRTLSAIAGRDGRMAGIVAAGAFGLCPLLAEGVFWISARADECVTLLTLVALLAWTRAPFAPATAFAVPLCVLIALGFKESASVFPLQLSLVAFAWPSRLTRTQALTLVMSFVLAGLFFAIRAHLFGDVWNVYRSAPTGSLAERSRHAVATLWPWWRGLSQPAHNAGTIYIVALGVATTMVLLATRGTQRMIAAALFIASAGLCVATLLNLGGMNPSGEGGRLTYSPFAWLCLAVGVASAAPLAATDRAARSLTRRAGTAGLVVATIIGTFVLDRELRVARDAMDDLHALANAIRDWPNGHAGLTLLVIDGERGPVVTGRNAQGGLVLPPIQPQPMLHRVLPALPAEIELRYDQLRAGLATRLAAQRPSFVDAAILKELAAP